jgi:hypothetical protein
VPAERAREEVARARAFEGFAIRTGRTVKYLRARDSGYAGVPPPLADDDSDQPRTRFGSCFRIAAGGAQSRPASFPLLARADRGRMGERIAD